MNISDYTKQINEILISNLPDNQKALALEMTADEINGIAWQSHARQSAEELSVLARSEVDKLPEYDPLTAMDGLAKTGLLKIKLT